MSFQAKLIIDDLEFNILTVEFAISRPVDIHNRPNGHLRGGIIDLTIETGVDHELINWIANNQTRDGRIEFYRRDASSSTQKIVYFTNAFCIYRKELFIANGSTPMTTKITISAHALRIDNETIQNTWAGIESESGSGTAGAGGSPTRASASENSVQFD